MALLLRDHGENNENDAAGLRHGIQVFLLEIHTDWRVVVLQRLDPHDTVHEVPGEAAHRLRDDEVDFSVHGVRHELLKALPVFRICA